MQSLVLICLLIFLSQKLSAFDLVIIFAAPSRKRVAEWFGASFLWQPWPQGWWFNPQPCLVVAFLDKMLHDNYLCLVESNQHKQQKKVRSKLKRKIRKPRQLLSEYGFVLYMAPPSLSRDRRIKMKKSIKSLLDTGAVCEPFAVFSTTKKWTGKLCDYAHF